MAIVIEKKIVEREHLKAGCFVEADIRLVNLDPVDDIKTYKCNRCSHYFDSGDADPYCPICGESDMMVEWHENFNSDEKEVTEKDGE